MPLTWRFGFILGGVAVISGLTARNRVKMGLANNRGVITAGLIFGVLSIVLAYVTYDALKGAGLL
jgi:hypothetical protein